MPADSQFAPEFYAALEEHAPAGEELREKVWEIVASIPAINDLSAQYQQDIAEAFLAALQPQAEGE